MGSWSHAPLDTQQVAMCRGEQHRSPRKERVHAHPIYECSARVTLDVLHQTSVVRSLP